jgi:hypothetical protein
MSETVRERIRKGLGEPGMPKREVEAITELAIQQEGMEGRSFGPGAPLRPYDGYSGRPRTRDYTTGYNISTRPRINEQVAFSTAPTTSISCVSGTGSTPCARCLGR